MVFEFYICNPFAGIAQLVEHDLAKVGVAGPSPVSRSDDEKRLSALRTASSLLTFLLKFIRKDIG